MAREPQRPRQPRPAARGRTEGRNSGRSFFTPGASTVRRTVEHHSAAPLVMLHRASRWIPPVAVAALLLIGFAAPRWLGGLAFLGLATFLGWLCYLSWPTLPVHGRVLRMAAILVLLAAATFRVTGIG